MSEIETTVRYAVEGFYVDRTICKLSDKPTTWVRVWKTWMECSSEERVQAVLNNGRKLITLKDFGGFSQLRVVKVIEQREVIFVGGQVHVVA